MSGPLVKRTGLERIFAGAGRRVSRDFLPERRPADTAAFPVCTPYYGVIFLREERPLTPEVLTHWAETLSQPLFGQPFSCTLAQVPSRQEAMEQFENEMRLMR